jgi:phosphatidylglycerophosphatase A
MKLEIERRKPKGLKDHLALALTTWGVGYLPLAPGTWGSMVGVAIYLLIDAGNSAIRAGGLGFFSGLTHSRVYAILAVGFVLFTLVGIWASGRAVDLLGNTDPSEAVVDEVLGVLVTFSFVPFGIGWPMIVAGFLLFRLFDIWKPYPINSLQGLPSGLGICADDIVAGVYAGIVLALLASFTL